MGDLPCLLHRGDDGRHVGHGHPKPLSNGLVALSQVLALLQVLIQRGTVRAKRRPNEVGSNLLVAEPGGFERFDDQLELGLLGLFEIPLHRALPRHTCQIACVQT